LRYFYNSTGNNNTAVGWQALSGDGADSSNTAVGSFALGGLSSGNNNTATGANALNIQIGSNNTADGFNALGGGAEFSGVGDANTAIGAGALGQVGWPPFGGSASGNIALGSGAGGNLVSGDNNIYVGNPGAGTESGTVRIGSAGTQTQTFIAGISGTALTGTAVVVNSSGQLGVATSSARYKEDIRSMDKASEALLSLRPVTFHYKKNIDPKGAPQFGLVAEEVEKVNPDLVVRDAGGKVFTVRYEAVNAMLLNEFLKEHRTVEELRATVAQQQKDFQAAAAHQQEQIEALTAGLQRVSAQIEMSPPAPQMVLNNQ
jgi:hypothetical protein